MIIFGHNNFLIKSYTLEDLGIFSEQDSSNISFQVRQRYAHLFWIPFFPIGKLWVTKKRGIDTLYEMPADIKSAILSRDGTPRTPWYSFALFFIGIGIYLFVLLGEAVDRHKWKNQFYNTLEETKMLIKYPTTGDCYVFTKYEGADRYSNTVDIILKVKQYDETKTMFVSLYPDLYQDAESNDEYSYHESFDLAEAFNYNPTYIDKKELVKALEDSYESNKTPVKMEPLKGYYILRKVDRRPLEENR